VPSLNGEANEALFRSGNADDPTQGLEVGFESRPQQDPDIKGIYFGKTIWVKPEESRAQQLKTLLHEVAHYYSEGVFQIDRADAETIAEVWPSQPARILALILVPALFLMLRCGHMTRSPRNKPGSDT